MTVLDCTVTVTAVTALLTHHVALTDGGGQEEMGFVGAQPILEQRAALSQPVGASVLDFSVEN